MIRHYDLKVLVIEDDEDTRANIHDILELDGYHVLEAASVKEALVQRDWANLFAIILDRQLPDGTADTLLPKLRELAPRAAVIVVTGFADIEGAVSVIRHGIADFIPKPINPDMLRASLARMARVRDMEERSRQDERLATIGQMMASVAHESRNALQRILSSADLLEMTLADDPEGLKDVNSIRRAASDLNAVLEELRSYAAPIHLDRHLDDIRRLWRSAHGKLAKSRHNGHLVLHEPNGCVDLQCEVDGFRIEQVFRNLFENSISAKNGDAEVRIDCFDEQSNGREMLRIIVQDDGPGLDEEQRSQVFEPFFTTKTEGTGLGMAIVRRIIESHGGQVAVIDPPTGSGAAVMILLPRCKEQPAE